MSYLHTLILKKVIFKIKSKGNRNTYFPVAFISTAVFINFILSYQQIQQLHHFCQHVLHIHISQYQGYTTQ